MNLQAENKELREENARLRSMLKQHLESKMSPVLRPSSTCDEQHEERPVAVCATCGWFLCATAAEVFEWMYDNEIAGVERGPDYRGGERTAIKEINLQRRGRHVDSTG